ncbi:MAG: DUF3987 domain-containing protein [Candidatus Hydrogenedentes bacterium]|nr:DUF3987 domain-containing protein [Candidatus Hydrogenedentota bacterium]
MARYDGDGGKDIVPFFKNEGDNWQPGAPQVPRPLFGLDVLAAKAGETEAFVVEGEKCAAALQSLGLPCVTSLGGAQSAHKADWAPLEGFGRVYLLPDADEPGESYVRALAEHLGASEDSPEAIVVRLPGSPKGGDVVDWLRKRLPDWDGYRPIPRAQALALRTELLDVLKREAVPVPPEWLSPGCAGNEQTADPSPEHWPEPRPLPSARDAGSAEAYPFEDLPQFLQSAAAEVARFAKVPKESPGIIGLPVLATAIGNKAEVEERPGLIHCPSLFFCLIAPSGERKSAPFKHICYPLESWTRAQQESYDDQRRRASARNDMVETRLKVLKAKAKNGSADFEALEDEIRAVEAQRLPDPHSPRPFTTDTTEQRLFQKMEEHGGAYAVLSGEGRPVLDSIMGKYSGDGRTGDAIYLAGISGDTITRDRVGSESGPEERVIYSPCLNVCIMVQPDKYLEFSRHPSLRASGALARIWPVSLPCLIGQRLERPDEPGLSPEAMKGFNSLVQRLLNHSIPQGEDGNLRPHRARLSAQAAEARRQVHNKIEQLMADGAELDDVRDIASKAVSQMCKIALILHLAQKPHLLKQDESVISGQTWAAAEAVGMYHLHEAVRLRRATDEDLPVDRARQTMRWLRKNGRGEVTATELAQRGPRPRLKAAQAAEVLELLTDYGYLRRRHDPGHQKPVYDVNPLISQSSQSKYPPAEPGALCCEPLKAAVRGR